MMTTKPALRQDRIDAARVEDREAQAALDAHRAAHDVPTGIVARFQADTSARALMAERAAVEERAFWAERNLPHLQATRGIVCGDTFGLSIPNVGRTTVEVTGTDGDGWLTVEATDRSWHGECHADDVERLYTETEI